MPLHHRNAAKLQRPTLDPEVHHQARQDGIAPAAFEQTQAMTPEQRESAFQELLADAEAAEERRPGAKLMSPYRTLIALLSLGFK